MSAKDILTKPTFKMWPDGGRFTEGFKTSKLQGMVQNADGLVSMSPGNLGEVPQMFLAFH